MAKTVVVTGAAGFIGSHLCEALLARGDRVTGVDCFTSYYPRALKERNLEALSSQDQFRFVEGDLTEIDLPAIFEGSSVVFHLAAQAGVRASWGREFHHYVRHNVDATQKILEAFKEKEDARLVFASSSSVYGKTRRLPTPVNVVLQPNSPYGATKVTGEHLCALYRENWGVDSVSLRYFTVFGPRQRPDMGFHKFIRAILEDRPLDVYGDGSQSRDCTFVGDVVDATIRAGDTKTLSTIFNVGGGSRKPLGEILEILQDILGRKARIHHAAPERGDVLHTHADISRTREELGYEPRTAVEDGLRQEAEWLEATLQDKRLTL